MAYCTVADLLIGDITTSTALNPDKYVNDAADEIDSKIGFRYATPVPISGADPAPRPVILLLKRINAHLASGRLILAATISANQEELNAYGQSLVNDAQLAIQQIAEGELILIGVDPAPDLPASPTDPDLLLSLQPVLHSNVDAVSQVESFYGAVTGGLGSMPSPYRAGG